MACKNENIKIYKRDRAEKDSEEYILECEAEFEGQLDSAVNDIAKRLSDVPDTRIITLSGPTCSGKTTTAGKIISELRGMGIRIFVISLDDFFKTVECDVNTYSELNSKLDLDSVEAIDILYLRRFISGIFKRENVYLPHFDFKKQRCISYRLLESSRYDVFLLEGIQAMYPDVRALLDGQPYISVFTNAASGIRIGNVFFNCREVRLMRRILRDNLFRSASVEFTMQIWKNVIVNEEESIFPNEKYADIILDSTLAYEPSVIKAPLLELLKKVSQDFPLYSEIENLIIKLEEIPDLSESFVPEKSVFREFFGKRKDG